MLSIPNTHKTIQDISTLLFKDNLNHAQNNASDCNLLNEYKLHGQLDDLNKMLIATYIEKLDMAFANSQYRKDTYYIKQIRTRTLVTTLGVITFKRRQYRHRETNAFFYYIDSLFELSAYQRLSNTLKFEVLKTVTQTSYAKTALSFGISKQAVFRLVTSLQSVMFNPPSFKEKRQLSHLYVQVDECYASLQQHKTPGKKSNKCRVEEITIHEGLLPLSKGRNKLINRTLFTRNYKESSKKFYQRVRAWIQANYTYEHLYLYGDGATWITNCASALNATFILDLYHTMQAINRLSRDKSIRTFATEFVVTNKKEAFIRLYEGLQQMQYPLTKSSLSSYEYLIKHWEHIQLNYTLPKSVGCSQEGINFHYFAARLTTFPRGWSEKNLRTMAGLLTLVHNHKSLHHIKVLLEPTIHSLENIAKQNDLGPVLAYTVIETLSEKHQFYRQGYCHLPHFQLN
jgi:Uncharacterised protein family (UPF0236).